MEGSFDVAVIGAGIEGSAIAHSLSSYNVRTVLLEQFPLPHTRGSSHGHSRGIRAAYGSKDYMTEMMIDAYTMWEGIERQTQKTILRKAGLLYFGDQQSVGDTIRCLNKHRLPCVRMTEKEVRRRWPGFRFPENSLHVLDKNAGVIRADVALRAFQELFLRNGGTIVDSARVVELIPGDDSITLETSRGRIRCRKVCLAAGPWTNKLLNGIGLTLPLKPLRLSVLYWKLKEGTNMDDYPNFIFAACEEINHVYSVMGDEYPGHVKVCPHSGVAVDPDQRDQQAPDPVRMISRQFVADHLPYLDASAPSIVETCMYTRTPDNDYILDRHPRFGNIFIAAGFSGHGFKMAPVVGRMMADMITDKQMKYNASHFRISRFTKDSKL